MSEPRLQVGSTIGRFAIVPEWLLRTASDEAVKLYAFLGAVWANQRHEAYPSLTTIADDMKCKPGKVKRVMRELVDIGAVTVKRRRKSDGTAVSNFYVLHPEQPGSKNDPFAMEPWSKNRPWTMDEKSTMDESQENSNNNGIFNDLRENIHGRKIDPKPEEPDVRTSSSSLSPEGLMEIWNTHRGQLPACAQLSSRRRTEARKRLKEQPDAIIWERVAKAIGADPGCNGQNKTGWRASFDYFLKPDVWLMVEEGRLNRRAPVFSGPRDANQMRRHTREANIDHVAGGEFHIVGSGG
jgi:hypothetical protein